VVKLWREDLQKKGLARAAESLADPLEYDNLFPDISLVRIPPRPFIKLSPFSSHTLITSILLLLRLAAIIAHRA
jgi:hypothetical protein